MRDVFELEPTTVVDTESSYLRSYPYIKDYFQRLDLVTAESIILGSHIVYGWMPTILDLYFDGANQSLGELVDVCEQARVGPVLNIDQLEGVASVINNSLVGASKLLHFINPSIYPIWDSKIYKFIHENKPHNYRVNDAALYIEYMSLLSEIERHEEFANFHTSVNTKIGYDVTSVRAIEIIMFLNAG